MMTASGTFHQRIVGRCIELLGISARVRGRGIWFPVLIGVILSLRRVVHPDLLFVRARRVATLVCARCIYDALNLIIEVVLPGSSAEATTQERATYVCSGEVEYVEIDLVQRITTMYRPEEDAYDAPARFDATQTLCLTCPTCRCRWRRSLPIRWLGHCNG